MQLRPFLELNEAMAVRALLDQVLKLEQLWDDTDSRKLELRKVLEMLDWALYHKSPLVQKLGELRKRIPPDPSYQQFLSLFVPIEREHGRLVSDADFLVRTGDHEEVQKNAVFPLILILDNIRSAFNVGSILRTAECMAIEKIYLCGYTPRPDQDKVSKAALGTEKHLAWEWRPHCRELLQELADNRLSVYALETSEQAIALEDFKFPQQQLGILVGNERYGLESNRLSLCAGTIEIPCWGRKNSLNVAVSLGMAAFECRRQWIQKGFLQASVPQ